MSTITMPTALNQALSEVAQQSMVAAVTSLAAKYEFDLEEAMRHLNLEEVKLVKKRGPSPKSKEEKEVAKAEKKLAAKAEKEAAKKEKKESKKSKGKAKSSSDEDEAKPKTKRGKTGYLMFADEVREEVKQELTEALDEGAKLLGKDVIREIAIRWKALSTEEQDVWKEQAAISASSEEEEE
jgi:hypothetical protein